MTENDEFDVWEFNKEMQKIISNHVLLLMEQYKTMYGIYGSSDKNINITKIDYWPQGYSQYRETYNLWMQGQIKLFESLIEEAIKDYTRGVEALEFRAQNKNRFQMLLKEHAKLWTENYERLRDKRKEIYTASLDALKKMLPEPVHSVLDNTNKWLMEQYEKLEDEMIEKIKKQYIGKK